jgi:hypothetical protein
MVKITVQVDEKVARRFKEEVVRKKGKLRGAMGKSLEDAMELWMKQEQR